eukprot:scaffold45133_cov42-Phaeocystis_antarctica.AAC.4
MLRAAGEREVMLPPLLRTPARRPLPLGEDLARLGENVREQANQDGEGLARLCVAAAQLARGEEVRHLVRVRVRVRVSGQREGSGLGSVVSGTG